MTDLQDDLSRDDDPPRPRDDDPSRPRDDDPPRPRPRDDPPSDDPPRDDCSPTNITPPTPQTPPSPFDKMTNQLQICNWLVQNPDYLRLANQMLAASNMDVDSSRISVKSIGSGDVEDINVSITL